MAALLLPAYAVAGGSTSVLAQTAEPARQLACRLERATNRISCDVLAETVSVRDARVNGGACRSPLLVFESKKWMIARMTGQDISTLKDFRGDYRRGDAFSFYADRECAVYRYDVTVGDGTEEFREK